MDVVPPGKMRTVSTVLLSRVGYALATWLLATYWTPLANAARPGAQTADLEYPAGRQAER